VWSAEFGVLAHGHLGSGRVTDGWEAGAGWWAVRVGRIIKFSDLRIVRLEEGARRMGWVASFVRPFGFPAAALRDAARSGGGGRIAWSCRQIPGESG
jgi:hypothetical protein